MLLNRLVLLSLAVLFLNACSSLSKSECVQGDWRSIGFNDAAKGARAESKLSQHSEACAKHQINPDNTVYLSGYKEGLKQFCTSDRGFSYGANGYRYLDICPAALKPTFVSAYVSGLDLAILQLEEEIDDARFARHRMDRKLLVLERKHLKQNQRTKTKDKDRKKDEKISKANSQSLRQVNLYQRNLKKLSRRLWSLISERDELVALHHKWSHSNAHSHTHQ